MIDIICQIMVVILGVPAIFLVGAKKKTGFIIGLLSQPFWIITALINHQPGVFVVSILYAGSWWFGVYNHYENVKVIVDKAFKCRGTGKEGG